MRPTTRPASARRAALILCLASGSAAPFAALPGCVAVPPEVKAEFADDDGARPNHYRVRPEGDRAAAEKSVFDRAQRGAAISSTGTASLEGGR